MGFSRIARGKKALQVGQRRVGDKYMAIEKNKIINKEEVQEKTKINRGMKIRSTIRKYTKDMTDVQFMKRKVASQKGRITKLEDSVHKLQYLIKDDMLALIDSKAVYKGNLYSTYQSAITEINRKYNGTADWGVLQTGSIIDLRAAFIVGDGIIISEKKPGEELSAELEWVEEFFRYNDLDKEVVQEFAKEAEIEGKIALKLAIEEDKEKDEEVEEKNKKWKVSVRFISWLDKKYKVETNPQDYLDYQKLTWPKTGTHEAETLDAKEFVYKKFGGRIMNPNEAAPKIMKCLTQVENLDKAGRDWREINNIFAGPILAAECENDDDVKSTMEALSDKNWKIKKVFVATSKLYYAQFDVKGVESIENEIVSLVKLISGTTGIPVHFLGFVDLMSNRSTAEDLINMINAATTKERQTWIGAYEEVIKKAMVMWNNAAEPGMSKEKQLDPDKIKVDIPIITKVHYDRLEKIFLPACVAGKISDEAFLTMIPGFDVKAEMERKEANEESELEQIKKENEDLKTKDLDKDLFGGGKKNAIPE